MQHLQKTQGEGHRTFRRGWLSQLAPITKSPFALSPYSLPPIPFLFILLQHSPTQRHSHNSFPVNQLHTLSIATEGVPPRCVSVLAPPCLSPISNPLSP